MNDGNIDGGGGDDDDDDDDDDHGDVYIYIYINLVTIKFIPNIYLHLLILPCMTAIVQGEKKKRRSSPCSWSMTSRMSLPPAFSVKKWWVSREIHGTSMGNHLKIMGKSWKNHGKKSWEIIWKSWENHGKFMGKPWEIHGNGVFHCAWWT